MFAEAQLQKWWARRSDDHGHNSNRPYSRPGWNRPRVELLVNTECPVGPMGTKWESQPEWDWIWPSNVRTFVAAQ
jgi:hypothetical protein